MRTSTRFLVMCALVSALPVSRVCAGYTSFIHLSPGQVVPPGGYIGLDGNPNGHHWQIVDYSGLGTAVARDTNANQAGGSGRELNLAAGAQLDYRANSGFFAGSFLFRLDPSSSPASNLIEINDQFSDFSTLIAAGNGSLGGASFTITAFPAGHAEFNYTFINSMAPPPLGFSFSIVGGGGVTVDNIDVVYLPEPTTCALFSLGLFALAAVRRRRI